MNKSPITVIVIAITVALLTLPMAFAADIQLSDTCSLADAITAANTDEAVGVCPSGDGADMIILMDDITLNASLPNISSEITIEGGGVTISGNERFQFFSIEESGALAINNLSLADGGRTADGDNFAASAIWNLGHVTITNSVFRNNSAGEGGAIRNFSEASITITNSTFVGNSATYGGAISNSGEAIITHSTFVGNSAGEGGAIFNWDNYASITIDNSTFSGNSTEWSGGAVTNMDLGDFASSVTVTNSTFSGNATEGYGGAINNGSGTGLAGGNDATVTVINSTFAGNLAKYGGAISNSGETSVTNSTLVKNTAIEGGGVQNWGVFYLQNSILADNNLQNSVLANDRDADCSGMLTENINNIIQNGYGTCFSMIHDDPLLDATVVLSDGSPSYFPLLEGSPAIDAGNGEFCPDTDIVGTSRPQGAACDIGAYELPQ